jgi:hypothetical protein
MIVQSVEGWPQCWCDVCGVVLNGRASQAPCPVCAATQNIADHEQAIGSLQRCLTSLTQKPEADTESLLLQRMALMQDVIDAWDALCAGELFSVKQAGRVAAVTAAHNAVTAFDAANPDIAQQVTEKARG